VRLHLVIVLVTNASQKMSPLGSASGSGTRAPASGCQRFRMPETNAIDVNSWYSSQSCDEFDSNQLKDKENVWQGNTPTKDYVKLPSSPRASPEPPAWPGSRDVVGKMQRTTCGAVDQAYIPPMPRPRATASSTEAGSLGASSGLKAAFVLLICLVFALVAHTGENWAKPGFISKVLGISKSDAGGPQSFMPNVWVALFGTICVFSFFLGWRNGTNDQ